MSGWAGDGGLDICEKETLILQHFFILWFSGGACEHTVFTTFIMKNNWFLSPSSTEMIVIHLGTVSVQGQCEGGACLKAH